jgi:ketosteroid isomerase-like protein
MAVPFSKVWFPATCLFLAACAPQRKAGAPEPSHDAARALLEAQEAAWNRHDLDGFLSGYRKDEQVVFVTPEGSSRGFADLEQRYKRTYNAPEKFGELKFENVEYGTVNPKSVIVQGTWRLKRATDQPHGRFVLVVCQLAEGWRIVSDFTTVESSGG